MSAAAGDRVAEIRIERKELGDLKAHPRNPRKHPEPGTPAWEALRASLESDYFDPLVWNRRNGFLVSGHLRRKILGAAGFTHADVSVVDYDEETHLARLIAANQLLGEWETEILANLAQDLSRAGFDPGLAGWTPKQLAMLVDGPTVDDDSEQTAALISEADKLAAKWKVNPGDVFAAGGQRLICGDCTIAANWLPALAGRQAAMVWTDPPYNVDYASLQEHRNAREDCPREVVAIPNDNLPAAAFERLLRLSFGLAFEFLRPGGAVYVAHAEAYGLLNRQILAETGFDLKQCLVWVKNSFTLGRQDYQWQHEPILYGWKPGAAHYWQGGFCQSTVIDDEETHLNKLKKPELIAIIQALRNARDTTVIREPKSASNELHPTIKPLPLVARHICNSTRAGELVIDLFNGSGTTLIAAQQTGRCGVSADIDPTFCAVTLERLTLAGLPVERIQDGTAIT